LRTSTLQTFGLTIFIASSLIAQPQRPSAPERRVDAFTACRPGPLRILRGEEITEYEDVSDLFRRSVTLAKNQAMSVNISKSVMVKSTRGTVIVAAIQRSSVAAASNMASEPTIVASYLIEADIAGSHSSFVADISVDAMTGNPATFTLRDTVSGGVTTFEFATAAVSCPKTGVCFADCALGKICSSLDPCELGILGVKVGACLAGGVTECLDVAVDLAGAALCMGLNCNSQCSTGSPGGCGHSECVTGGKLTSSCSTCASTVCKTDSYCCTTAWDGQCVSEAKQLCGNACGTTPTPTPTPPPSSGNCAHSVCTAGTALTKSCSTCATGVCNADSYCCNNKWDSICVSEAKQLCGNSCP